MHLFWAIQESCLATHDNRSPDLDAAFRTGFLALKTGRRIAFAGLPYVNG